MSKFIEVMDKIYKKGGGYEKMADGTAILDIMFEKLMKIHPDLYDETMHEFEEIAYHIDKEEATTIVEKMKPQGEVHTYEKVKELLKEKGITEHCTKWYLVLNMVANDNYSTIKKFGAGNEVDMTFELAKDFITDADGVPHKVEKYFLMY